MANGNLCSRFRRETLQISIPDGSVTDTASAITSAVETPSPTWLRLSQNGDAITGFASHDGSAWTQVASTTFDFGSAYYLGIAICSGSDSTTHLAVFDDISVGSIPINPQTPSGAATPAAFSNLSVQPGFVDFTISGEPGSVWLLQQSPDMIHWTPLQSTTLLGGAIQHEEPNEQQVRRFFRLLWQP